MERKERLYPINEEKFRKVVLPIIEATYRGKGVPSAVSHYRVFCGMIRGLWANILLELQEGRQ
ncbi:MAG: hypothetical protein LBP19_00780 [Treponema sp.]|nr:hypothetical protein [Treponema sp.]